MTSDATVTPVSAVATLTFTEIDANNKDNSDPSFAKRSDKLQQVAITNPSSNTYTAVHKYYNGSTYVPYGGTSGLYDFAAYQITIRIADSGQAADIVASGKNIKLSIVTLTTEGAAAADTDRLFGWFDENLPSTIECAGAFGAQADQKASTQELTFATSGKTASDWTTGFPIGYLGVFFHGEDNPDGTTGLVGNVYVKAQTV